MAFADNISGLEKKLLIYLKVQRQLPASDAVFRARAPKRPAAMRLPITTVQPSLGTMEDLAALSEKCHDRGKA